MSRYAADVTVASVVAIRAAERRRSVTVPTPLVAFALVNLGGVVATILLGRFHLALYGIPAFTLAVWVSARVFARQARTEGVQVAIRPWALTAAALCLGAMGASRAGVLLDIAVISAVGPFLAQAAGLWLFGRWAGSDELRAAAGVMVVASLLIGSVATGDVAVALQFAVYGTVLLVASRLVTMRTAPA